MSEVVSSTVYQHPARLKMKPSFRDGMKARVLKTQKLISYFLNINTCTRFIKVENTHWSKQNMLHLLENMVAVLFENHRSKRTEASTASVGILEYMEYCSSIGHPRIANQSECLILICLKITTGKGQKKSSNRKKCAKWQLKGCAVFVANKKGKWHNRQGVEKNRDFWKGSV